MVGDAASCVGLFVSDDVEERVAWTRLPLEHRDAVGEVEMEMGTLSVIMGDVVMEGLLETLGEREGDMAALEERVSVVDTDEEVMAVEVILGDDVPVGTVVTRPDVDTEEESDGDGECDDAPLSDGEMEAHDEPEPPPTSVTLGAPLAVTNALVERRGLTLPLPEEETECDGVKLSDAEATPLKDVRGVFVRVPPIGEMVLSIERVMLEESEGTVLRVGVATDDIDGETVRDICIDGDAQKLAELEMLGDGEEEVPLEAVWLTRAERETLGDAEADEGGESERDARPLVDVLPDGDTTEEVLRDARAEDDADAGGVCDCDGSGESD